MRRPIAGLLCVLLAAPVYAQKHTDKERAAQARQAFEAGKKAYNLGDFDKAVELWKQAYEYRDDPIFLYNIAQAYRQKADFQKAIFFYRAYLREEPRAKNRAEVEGRIGDLQKQLDAQPPPQPEPEPAPAPPPPPPAPTPAPRPAPVVVDEEPAEPHPGRGMKITGLVTGGVGVAVLATGVVFALRARSIQSDLETAAHSGQPWSQELVDKESSGRTSNTIGILGICAGAAAIATGATLFWLGTRKDAAAARAEVAIGPGGAALAVSFAY